MQYINKTKLSYIITLPHIVDEGSLCVAEANNHIPFPIKRLYYIFGVEENTVRGKHAHHKTQQVLFCIQGKISILLDNGLTKEKIILDSPNQGIFLDTMMWHEMASFQKNTILLVLASDFYRKEDYIHDYKEFYKLIQKPIIQKTI